MTAHVFTSPAGEMARRIREMDWSTTPLGSSDAWPQSLKFSIAMILVSGFPMAIRWGPELALIYNDAYRPILGDKHPAALGRALRYLARLEPSGYLQAARQTAHQSA